MTEYDVNYELRQYRDYIKGDSDEMENIAAEMLNNGSIVHMLQMQIADPEQAKSLWPGLLDAHINRRANELEAHNGPFTELWQKVRNISITSCLTAIDKYSRY